jgi:DNA-binding transcriptional LysR family regulator
MDTNDLKALSTFLTVAEERSFTRAAKYLSVSPSAISHSMRELEGAIGVRLLSRTTRSVALTEAGEQLRSRLRPALMRSSNKSSSAIDCCRTSTPSRPR